MKAAITTLQNEVTLMSVTQAQFDTDLTKQGADLTILLDLIPQLIAALNAAKLQTADLTQEDTAINSQDASINTQTTAVRTALGLST